MAIVKMKAVTIAAQISEFDTVVEKYVYGRDIHLENAMSVISNRGKLKTLRKTRIRHSCKKCVKHYESC